MKKLKIAQHDIDANQPLRLSSTSTLTITEIKDGDIDIKYQPYQYLLTTAESVVSNADDSNISSSHVISSNHVASIGQKKTNLLRQATLLANLRSFLKASPHQQAPPATVLDVETVVVNRDDALTHYIKDMCSRTLAELQQLCQPPTKADGFLTAAQWVSCWDCGAGGRVSILGNIASCLRDAHHDHPFLPYLIDYHPEFAKVNEFVNGLTTFPWGLQDQCRTGGKATAAKVLCMSREEWMNCYRNGRDCDDAIAAEVAACIDRRAFTKIDFVDPAKKIVSGFLVKPLKKPESRPTPQASSA
ncbi:Hypothetical protein, putative [Bodo saltans]|uniref:Uncharacterized protein n=1 Tax=Bodo saltans TaxID=75058 RepID=A0A0S4IKE0_BODSA|nr:Hypothetical protein, putative [Bodo saltans]|eukprot:CUE64547.1 Hypothetical protein, putative [Bodo saltans]